MRRVVFGFMVSFAAIGVATPSLSADLGLPKDIRSGYNDWDNADKSWDPLMEFEAGLRYVYSHGGSLISTSGDPSRGISAVTSATSDTAHFIEAHLRLNDLATDTYLSAYGGYSINLDTAYLNPISGLQSSSLGQVAYVVTDFGYTPLKLGDDDLGGVLGGFIGYQYMHEMPNIGNHVASVTGGAPVPNHIIPAAYGVNVNALRLGITGKANLGAFDIKADLAAIPYASIAGVLNGYGVPGVDNGTTTTYQAIQSPVAGSGWGAAADLTLGYNVTQDMAIRVGGRATYLQGQMNTVTDPAGGAYNLTEEYLDAFSMWRYGLMAELTVKF